MNLRHISRFTYEFTSFQGWRVAICRQGATLARYFSDKQYGSPEASCEQAIRFRDMVLAELQRDPLHTRDILHKHRIKPRQLHPSEAAQEPAPTGLTPTCAIRAIYREGAANNNGLYEMLRKMCQHLQLDISGVLKLSLYLFTFQYGAVTATASERKNNTEWLPRTNLTDNGNLNPPEPMPSRWEELMHFITAKEQSAPPTASQTRLNSQREAGNMRPPSTFAP